MAKDRGYLLMNEILLMTDTNRNLFIFVNSETKIDLSIVRSIASIKISFYNRLEPLQSKNKGYSSTFIKKIIRIQIYMDHNLVCNH